MTKMPPKQLGTDPKIKKDLKSNTAKENTRSTTRPSTGSNRPSTACDATKTLRTSATPSSSNKQTPLDSKTLTVNTKLRNLKNVEDQEKLVKSERIVAEADLIALKLMQMKMDALIVEQNQKSTQILSDLAKKTRDNRRQADESRKELDEKLAWTNLLETTEMIANKIKNDLNLTSLGSSLQTIYAETEEKNSTLPLTNFQNAEHLDEILEQICYDSSGPEKQNALRDMCKAQNDLSECFNVISNILGESKAFTDKLVNTLDLQQQLAESDAQSN